MLLPPSNKLVLSCLRPPCSTTLPIMHHWRLHLMLLQSLLAQSWSSMQPGLGGPWPSSASVFVRQSKITPPLTVSSWPFIWLLGISVICLKVETSRFLRTINLLCSCSTGLTILGQPDRAATSLKSENSPLEFLTWLERLMLWQTRCPDCRFPSPPSSSLLTTPTSPRIKRPHLQTTQTILPSC